MQIKDAISILLQIIESHQITIQGKQIPLAAQALQRAAEFVQESEESAPAVKNPS
jgi:hypothetical protein